MVKPYKKLYSVVGITGKSEHTMLFLEVVQRSSYTIYKVWEQLTDFCICIGSAPEYATTESLTKGFKEYQFLGVDGYLKKLKQTEKLGGYINLVDIEVCRILGHNKLQFIMQRTKKTFFRKELSKKQMNKQKESKKSMEMEILF